MAVTIPLSEAKARLSEVVRKVRNAGEDVVITVDGEPAARLSRVTPTPRELTPTEVATHRALFDSIARMEGVTTPFDAVDLVREGRR